MNPGDLRHKIVFEKLNDDTEEWASFYTCHAKVNIASGREYFSSGAEQSESSTIFTVRYCKSLEAIGLNAQAYRIKFRSGIYDIQVVDNFMYMNQILNIKAVGKLER